MRISKCAEKREGSQRKGILRKKEVEEGKAHFLLSEKKPKQNQNPNQKEIMQYGTLTIIWFVLHLHSVLHKLQSQAKKEETYPTKEKGLAIPG